MSSSKGTALITGASAGIGATYADRLARRGYDLILVARDKDKLAASAKKLASETGVKVDVLPADLTKKADLVRVEDKLANDSAIALFVNNAGIVGPPATVGADRDELEKVIALNITAATRLAAAAATAFASRKRGAIVNLSSAVAYIPERFGSAYGASKAYVLHLSQSLDHELKDKGVQVQAVLPGLTRTEIFDRAGIDISMLDPNAVMDVDELVDAALVGFDKHELVTIPSLPDVADYQAIEAARGKLVPNLSRNHPAERYKKSASRAA
ncbi:MAG TPA: SDR family oxidoreductase [Methylovirgula sp.]